jgi:hypothetical protein
MHATCWKPNLVETNLERKSMLPRVEGVETGLELPLVSKREFTSSTLV